MKTSTQNEMQHRSSRQLMHRPEPECLFRIALDQTADRQIQHF